MKRRLAAAQTFSLWQADRRRAARTFFRTLDDTFGRGMGCSDSPTSAIEGQHIATERAKRAFCDAPSSMFLMRTLRSATSLSTTNCSLSEVTRRTMLIVEWRDGEEGGDGGLMEGEGECGVCENECAFLACRYLLK